MVVGRWRVSWGVSFAGVEGPKAAMELGKKKAAPRSRAASSAVQEPHTLMSHDERGSPSPFADRTPARWITVSALKVPNISEKAFPSRTSSSSKGPPSDTGPGTVLRAVASTFSAP